MSILIIILLEENAKNQENTLKMPKTVDFLNKISP